MGNSNFNNKNSHNPFDNVSDDDDDLFDDIEPVQQGSPSQPQHHHIATNANNRYQFDNSPYRRSSSYDVYNNNPLLATLVTPTLPLHHQCYNNNNSQPCLLYNLLCLTTTVTIIPFINNNSTKSIELQLAPIQTPHTVLWLIMMNSNC